MTTNPTPPAEQMTEAGMLPPAQAKALWKKHGGRQHGPIVEHYSIEEQAWYRFVSELQQQALAARQPDPRVLVLEEAREVVTDLLLELDGAEPSIVTNRANQFLDRLSASFKEERSTE